MSRQDGKRYDTPHGRDLPLKQRKILRFKNEAMGEQSQTLCQTLQVSFYLYCYLRWTQIPPAD